jgi:hypothetical protein
MRRQLRFRRVVPVTMLCTGAAMTALALAVPSGAVAQTTTTPVVEHVFPNHGSASKYSALLITGQNLSASSTGYCLFFDLQRCNTTVHVGEQEAFVFFASSRFVIIIAPKAAMPGTVNVTVSVAGVNSEMTPADEFTYE